MVKKKIKRNIRIARYVIYKETLVNFKEMLWSFVGAFFGIGIIAFIQSIYLDHWGNIFLIGSFGASSVFVYGATQSPLAQPRNLIVGHLVSAIIGVTIYQFMPHIIWITAPLAVASSIIIMQITKSLHPPGGATALIAVIGSEKVTTLGYLYVISPVLSGSLILLVVALVFNNMAKQRVYPTSKRLRSFFNFRKLTNKYSVKNEFYYQYRC